MLEAFCAAVDAESRDAVGLFINLAGNSKNQAPEVHERQVLRALAYACSSPSFPSDSILLMIAKARAGFENLKEHSNFESLLCTACGRGEKDIICALIELFGLSARDFKGWSGIYYPITLLIGRTDVDVVNGSLLAMKHIMSLGGGVPSSDIPGLAKEAANNGNADFLTYFLNIAKEAGQECLDECRDQICRVGRSGRLTHGVNEICMKRLGLPSSGIPEIFEQVLKGDDWLDELDKDPQAREQQVKCVVGLLVGHLNFRRLVEVVRQVKANEPLFQAAKKELLQIGAVFKACEFSKEEALELVDLGIEDEHTAKGLEHYARS